MTYANLTGEPCYTPDRKMALLTRKPRNTRGRRNVNAAARFPRGSLEAKLTALGRKVPLREWNRLPPASSSNVDSVVYGKSRTR